MYVQPSSLNISCILYISNIKCKCDVYNCETEYTVKKYAFTYMYKFWCHVRVLGQTWHFYTIISFEFSWNP